jgi:hypothetical protein
MESWLWKRLWTCRKTDYYMIELMHIACWVTKTTDTHTAYVILIAFAQQHFSVLHYTYIVPILLTNI